MCVTNMAIPALSFAAAALPALKPNHPTQSMEAPIITIPGLCGGFRLLGKPCLLPNIHAIVNADAPAVA